MAIFAYPVFFRTGRYHLERGGMRLHYVVGINCKKCATTENQGADVKYLSKGVYVDDHVHVIRLGMTTPLGGERKSWYIIIIMYFS